MATQNGGNPILPYRIGIMVDMPGYPGGSDMFPEAVRFAFEEAHANRVIDRPVECVLREYLGQPWGSGLSNRDAYLDLVKNEKVLAIAGPLTTDNCMALTEITAREQVPVFTICGTYKFGGPYCFNVSNGNLADEPAYIAAWLAASGHKRIAVLRDYPSKIGMEYHRFLEYAAQLYGLQIVATANTAPTPEIDDLPATLASLREQKPDALVYLGFGAVCRLINVGLKKIDWWPPRIMTTAFVSATLNRQCALDIDGWHGIDQYDERNARFRDMLARYKQAKGREMVPNSLTSTGYDIGRCLAIALSRMEIATPEAVVDALETIRMLPAMTGGPNTYISFGHYDHRGFKGRDYLCVRRSVNGTTEFVPFELPS